MGVLNVTPDSFSDGGIALAPDVAVRRALSMAAEGADIIDVGGESTRPGAPAVTAEEEWRRVGPVLEQLVPVCPVPVSIDTYKAEIAQRALALGAAIVNDVSGFLYDDALPRVVANTGAVVVLMHHRGRSADMYAQADYGGDVVGTVTRELAQRVDVATGAGIPRERIILDPGLGFAKRAEQTFDVLAGFHAFAALGYPLLSGPSKKSFLNVALGKVDPPDRLWGSAAAVTASVLAGAHIVRVHDVKEMVQVVKVADKIRDAASSLEL
jgi:dihydropteroate synthase